MEQYACELQLPTDPLIWITIALSCSGIPICAYFLLDSWRAWRPPARILTRVQSSQLSRELVSSKSGINKSTHFHDGADPTADNIETSRAQRTVSEASKVTIAGILPVIQTPPSWSLGGRPLQEWLQRLSFSDTLHLLLFLSWFLLTIDQILDASYACTVALLCPQYNCKRRALVRMPGCPAPLFATIQLCIQPLASCLFVLATMNRFIRVYAVLSRPRQMALQFGSGTIIVATGLRWMTIPFLEKLVYLPTGVYDEESEHPMALLLYNLSFHGAYLVQAAADIVALLLGLHYVLQVRSELNEFRKAEGGAIDMTAQSGASIWIVTTTAASSPTIAKRAKYSAKWRQRQENCAATALAWIMFNFAVLAVYVSIMLVSETLANLPVQFVLSLLTILLKLFGAGMTFSIRAMTRLVAARGREHGVSHN